MGSVESLRLSMVLVLFPRVALGFVAYETTVSLHTLEELGLDDLDELFHLDANWVDAIGLQSGAPMIGLRHIVPVLLMLDDCFVVSGLVELPLHLGCLILSDLCWSQWSRSAPGGAMRRIEP